MTGLVPDVTQYGLDLIMIVVIIIMIMMMVITLIWEHCSNIKLAIMIYIQFMFVLKKYEYI